MLGRALKLLRTYHQLKQVVLAKRLEISNSYLSEIEKGDKTPGVDLLQKYAEIFKMPVSSIMLFAEKMETSDMTAESIRVKAAEKVLRLLEWIEERGVVEQGS